MKELANHLLLLVLFSCSSSITFRDNWKDRSEHLAYDFSQSLGKFDPEYVSQLGFDEFDSKVTFFSSDLDDQRYAHLTKWKLNLSEIWFKEKDIEYKTDVKILLDQVNLEIEKIELHKRYGVVPFIPMTEYIFLNLKELLNKKSSKIKLNSGLKRFKSYVRGEEDKEPLFEGLKLYILNSIHNLKEGNEIWPGRYEVSIYLSESENYLKAIEELLNNFPEREWRSDFNLLVAQERDYKKFLKFNVLPKSRPTIAIPKVLYTSLLNDYGVKWTQEELISIGKKDYFANYKIFKELGKKIAESNNLKKNDPVSVVNFLRKKKIENNDELLSLYRKTTQDLFSIIKKNELITIDDPLNMVIRFASKAEAKSLPAPHFISAPLLKDNSTIPSQFVITPTMGGRDDFSYPEAVITLTAHEAVPGHALQHETMSERGTTLIRSKLGFNSANVEGWALYAEDIVYPYLSVEAQFITIQRRLWRQARMFLDPELNLGLIKPKRVLDLFTGELGFSRLFAQSELDRYSYIIPGQAPSYYYGLKSLLRVKEKWKRRDKSFNEKCFNDTVLQLGVLPLDQITQRLENLNCSSLE